MSNLRKARIHAIMEDSDGYEDVDVFTSGDSVTLNNGKTLEYVYQNEIGDITKLNTSNKDLVNAVNENTYDIKTNTDDIKNISADLSDMVINVKYPPLGLTSAKGDNAIDDTNALQAIINYCQTNKCKMYIPKGYYKITDTLVINDNITICGQDCNELYGNISSNWNSINIPTVAPYLEGSIIVQTTNGKDAIKVQGATPVVNLKDFGVLFPDSLTSTGHGINATPDELTDHTGSYNNGVFSCLWENIKVYGHDGNHYAFVIINALYDTFTNLRWYGGGGIFMDCNSAVDGHYGGDVFINPMGQTFKGGTADGIRLNCTTECLNNIIFIRPQSMICNYYAVNPPTSSQYIFYCHAKNVQIQIESYDFETLVNSKILFPLGMRSEQGSISGSAFLENTQINNTGVNAKCPPVWLTPCVADGINDDYEALQALIYYCQDHNCKLIIPSGNYKITKTLIINNSITIEGEGCNELFGDIETNANSISIPTVVPHLLGTVIVQESYLTAICIQGKSPVVNLKNFGIILENGGCGIQILPDLLTDGTHRNTGISSSVWDNIKVYSGNAKSGDYSFYLVNFINCTFNNLSSYGGGGIYVASQSNTRYGYSTFIKPKLLLWLGCNSDVFRINDDNISDIDIIKPIVNVFNHINPSNPPTSSQYIFYCPQSASQIKLYDYSFGSNTSIKLLLPNTDDNTLGTIGSDIVNESTQKYRSVLPSGTKLETGGVGAGTSSATSGHVTFQSFSQECKTVFVEVNGINITKSNITKDGFDWTLSGEGNGTFYWLAFGY